jgi:septal ring factor EnvC (AmiA/AmiB activator)
MLANRYAKLLDILLNREQVSLDGTLLAKQKDLKELGYRISDLERQVEEAGNDLEKARDEIAEAEADIEQLRERQEQIAELRTAIAMAASPGGGRRPGS